MCGGRGETSSGACEGREIYRRGALGQLEKDNGSRCGYSSVTAGTRLGQPSICSRERGPGCIATQIETKQRQTAHIGRRSFGGWDFFCPRPRRSSSSERGLPILDAVHHGLHAFSCLSYSLCSSPFFSLPLFLFGPSLLSFRSKRFLSPFTLACGLTEP